MPTPCDTPDRRRHRRHRRRRIPGRVTTSAYGGAVIGATPGPRALNAAQAAFIELFRADDEPLSDTRALAGRLELELARGLAPLVRELPDGDDLWISKHRLSSVHACEAKFVAEEAVPFAWTPPTARGTVAHKAIELSVHLEGEPVPLELVDEAIASLTNAGGSLADYLQTIGTAERAELRALANDRVATFLECFPPLKPRWWPVTESNVRVDLMDGRVVLKGKVDVTLGRAQGPGGKGKVLIDFKTGGFRPSHLDDLRFYALLETIKYGSAPRMVASYYLESARPHAEVVTEGLLEAALARTIDGARRLVELQFGGATPTRHPSVACRWCPVLHECPDGRAHLAGDDTPVLFDDDDLPDD